MAQLIEKSNKVTIELLKANYSLGEENVYLKTTSIYYKVSNTLYE